MAGARGDNVPRETAAEAFHFLLSATGQSYLEQLARSPITDDGRLALAARLRLELSPEETHAVIETALLRQRAVVKFSRASQMYFTREALEQASPEAVSRYRAGRFSAATIADLGCSIGGDSLALAAHAAVIGIDADPLRLRMARENVRVYGHSQRFHPLLADLTQLPALNVDAFFADPARRDDRGRRLYNPDDYRPPLNALLSRWLPHVPNGAVKISPGIDYAHIPAQASIEFISLNGEVKEGVLWFGDLRDASQRRATLLPSAVTLSDLDNNGDVVPVAQPGAYLYEPDGAVIRAHLIEALAQQLGAWKIDDTIAYLTSDEAVQTPFARCFVIDETMPFHLKKLRARLRELGIGRITVKKRGSPLTPEELQRRLDLSGEREAILFLTRVQSQPVVLIGRESSAGAA